MELNERIKKIRTDADLTQKEFGEKIGVGRIYVSGWETNQVEPGKARLFVIAEKFSVNIDWLLTGEGEPYKNAVVVDPKTRDEIERAYIQSVFESLPEDVQRQILAVLHKLVDKCEQTTTKNVTTNNQIEVHGAINGNVVINNEGKE